MTIDGQEADGYYDLSKFEVRDKYAAFLRGNNGYTVIKSGVREVPEGQEPSKILVIKDSYANSFVPFLCTTLTRCMWWTCATPPSR